MALALQTNLRLSEECYDQSHRVKLGRATRYVTLKVSGCHFSASWLALSMVTNS